jgi:hypothetical protein
MSDFCIPSLGTFLVLALSSLGMLLVFGIKLPTTQWQVPKCRTFAFQVLALSWCWHFPVLARSSLGTFQSWHFPGLGTFQVMAFSSLGTFLLLVTELSFI